MRDLLLRTCFVSSGRSLRAKIDDSLIPEILELTSFLPKETKLSDRIYALLNCQTENNYCLTCGSVLVPAAYNPQLFCNSKCGANHPDTKIKRAKTCLKVYGVEYPGQTPDVVDKRRETCIKRYGVDNPLKSDFIKDKVKLTNQERYGVDWTLQSEEVRKKGNVTNLEKYGTPNAGGSEESQAKVRKTMLERYGVENAGQSPLIQARMLKTNIERYGMGNKSILDKDVLDQLNNKDSLYQLYIRSRKSVPYMACSLGVSVMTVWNYIYKHKLRIKSSKGISLGELHFRKLIQNNYSGPIEFGNRSLINPYEVDIYLPELKIAIEYDGLYWHSEGMGKTKNYHLSKTLACADKGVQLFHIFSSDPVEIWDSLLLMKLGKSVNIGARLCKVVDVSTNDSYLFLTNNHLQGPIHGSIRKGLMYEDELVSLMTFGKPRYTSDNSHELLRFCTKKGYRVIGGASKLLKHSGVDNCVSYANLRWSVGNVYENLGFKLVNRSLPNYWYTNDYTTVSSRQKFQKHKLSSKLELFNPELSENANMILNGYDRIFDCGNLVYTLGE